MSSAILPLFHEVSQTLGKSDDLPMALQDIAQKIGHGLGVDRCLIMLLSEQKDSPTKSFKIFGEYAGSSFKALKSQDYPAEENSPFYSLLKAGKPLSLKDLPQPAATAHKEEYFSDSKEFLAVPLLSRHKLMGCLLLNYCLASKPFSDEIIMLAKTLAETIAWAYDRALILNSSENEKEKQLFEHPLQSFDPERSARAEELATNLSKQLSWERWTRQIVCKLHSTLDRDTLLQAVVDEFGRALSASRCLIVRTDGLVSPAVTHEYVEPDISPLGLGRTGQFPLPAVFYFTNKIDSIPDVSALVGSGGLSANDYEYFVDNGIHGITGAPIAAHGITFGIIVILESGQVRRWSPHELDMLEIVATQTAIALGHGQAYLKLKEQLFNMNLLGNLTQQLTSTLEFVSRSARQTEPEKAKPINTAPPLSLRELEVLKLIASGLANREIAQRLFLTESTVELHASRIRKKLKLKSRTALVKFACDNNLA